MTSILLSTNPPGSLDSALLLMMRQGPNLLIAKSTEFVISLKQSHCSVLRGYKLDWKESALPTKQSALPTKPSLAPVYTLQCVLYLLYSLAHISSGFHSNNGTVIAVIFSPPRHETRPFHQRRHPVTAPPIRHSLIHDSGVNRCVCRDTCRCGVF